MGSRVALPPFLFFLLTAVVAVGSMLFTFLEPCNLDSGACLNAHHNLGNHNAFYAEVYGGVVSIYESHLIFYFNILLCFLVKFSKASCSAGGKTAYTDRASPLLPGHPHLFILNSTFCIREMNFWVIHLSDTKEHVTIIRKG